MLGIIRHATVAYAFILTIVILMALCVALIKASVPVISEKTWAYDHAVCSSPLPAPTADATPPAVSLTPQPSNSSSATASEPPPASSPKPPPTQFPTGLVYAVTASVVGVAIIAITSAVLGRKLQPQASTQKAGS